MNLMRLESYEIIQQARKWDSMQKIRSEVPNNKKRTSNPCARRLSGRRSRYANTQGCYTRKVPTDRSRRFSRERTNVIIDQEHN